MNAANQKGLSKRIDWIMVGLWALLSLIGLMCIFSVEYRETDASIFLLNKNYMRQAIFLGISAVLAIVIVFTDSKVFTAIPYLSYLFGILLLILVLFIGKGVKGSHSWMNLGIFSFQPGELAKMFTALALAKFLSSQETDFRTLKHRLIAAAIALLPSLIIIMQNETGLALVYFSFFLVMYREGLPNSVLVVGFSVILLVLITLLIPKNTLFIVITAIAALSIFVMRKQIKRSKELLLGVIGIWVIAVVFSQLVVPMAFKKVLKPYQVERIYSMIGQDAPEEYLIGASGEVMKRKDSDYNVRQAKIAIGSGGLLGKGFLKGTQTRYEFVPEQSTDFIFCTIGEEFGFVGSLVLLCLYLAFLLRIISVAERQRSTFTRVYAYSVACIIFFHLAVNISMTIGLAPVIGIPLPLISYGGSSLVTFTMIIFILVRLDADRQMVLR